MPPNEIDVGLKQLEKTGSTQLMTMIMIGAVIMIPAARKRLRFSNLRRKKTKVGTPVKF
jgi:hypothetical protein